MLVNFLYLIATAPKDDPALTDLRNEYDLGRIASNITEYETEKSAINAPNVELLESLKEAVGTLDLGGLAVYAGFGVRF